jgi:hypothetical protein
LLSPIFDVENSAWVVVVLSQFLATAGILLICRELHGRITSFCLFALPLIYGHPFNFGFINFTLSMALALLAFALWLRLGRIGRFALRAWLFVPLSLGIWLCHTYGWGFLGLLCAADSLVRSREAGRDWPATVWNAAWGCLPLAAPLAPMVLWHGQASMAGSTGGWFLFGDKLSYLLGILRLDNEAADKLSAIILLGLVYVGLRSPCLSRSSTMVVAAAFCLFAFLILPQHFGSAFADMRLAPYMMIVALLAIGEGSLAGRPRHLLMAAGLLFLAVRVALSTATYAERERILDKHLEALDAIPERARVATLVSLSCTNTWKLPWLLHVGSLALARKHAFVNDQWSAGGVNPLSVHYPAAGRFATDPSQMVPCNGNAPVLRPSLMAIPAKAFTHVWIIGRPTRAYPTRPDLTLIWQGPDSAVYKVAGPVTRATGALPSTALVKGHR